MDNQEIRVSLGLLEALDRKVSLGLQASMA